MPTPMDQIPVLKKIYYAFLKKTVPRVRLKEMIPNFLYQISYTFLKNLFLRSFEGTDNLTCLKFLVFT